VRRLAIRSALSAKAAEGRIAVLDRLELAQPKTSVLAKLLRGVAAEGKVLLVTAGADAVVSRSAANLPGLRVVQATNLNLHAILTSDWLVIVRDALDRIAEVAS
jgi:large subunit ribosomal protein L4